MPIAKRHVGALAATALLVLTSGCSTDDRSAADGPVKIPATPEPGTFRLGTQPWIGYAPWYIAEEKGYAKQHRTAFEQVNFTTDDQLNAALAGGKIDGANVSSHTALNLIASGVDIRIVMLEDVSKQADAVLTRAGTNSIKALKGKRVAYEEGTTSDILLRYGLRQNGMDIDDIKRVPMSATDAGSAFLAGRVDAAVTYEPYVSAAQAKQPTTRSVYSAAENPGLISDVFVVRADVLAEKPGQVAALVKTWNDAVGEYAKAPEASRAVMARGVGANPKELGTAFDGIEYYGRSENETKLTGEYVSSVLPEVASVAKDAGLLQGDVDTDAAVDGRYLPGGKQS
ncbi:ABC transporter substrate-binding protein [Streptomyces sp. NBC_01166]|uniref:ABC transporter substrate-binding protein n=1 Tax=Streptomyces sp. NBC_01166 TaxID=2903755 RepID=UPI00386DD540|nr:ABC transporter substrate-binding protein [Streptomyces sp. NBC_01166]